MWDGVADSTEEYSLDLLQAVGDISDRPPKVRVWVAGREFVVEEAERDNVSICGVAQDECLALKTGVIR